MQFPHSPGKRMTSWSDNALIAIAFTVVIATLLAAGLARHAVGRKPDRIQELVERMCSNYARPIPAKYRECVTARKLQGRRDSMVRYDAESTERMCSNYLSPVPDNYW
jgi:hypothetical protein